MSLAAPASADVVSPDRFVRAVDRMMSDLATQNAEASAVIRDTYSDYFELLVLGEYADLEDALGNGGLVPLPPDPFRFNVIPRMAGIHPIGEMDLENQASYLAARPATIGCLLDVASRVISGPIEVTSLVRHLDYQEGLRSANANAITAVPMHTMGLAFDIALLNMPIERVDEILNVLRSMRDAGDILFIGERRQLVFHVVPHPSRLGYFNEIYARALAAPQMLPDARPLPLTPMAPPTVTRASVSAEIIDVRPTEQFSAAWWAAMDPSGDLSIRVVDRVGSGRHERVPRPTIVAAVAMYVISVAAASMLLIWRPRR